MDIAFADYFADAQANLRPLADDGLVELGNDRVAVTETSRLFLRNIGMAFGRYMKDAPSDKPRYSRTA